jgi:hypothetical protein
MLVALLAALSPLAIDDVLVPLYTVGVAGMVMSKFLDEKRGGHMWYGHDRAKHIRPDDAEFAFLSGHTMPKKVLVPFAFIAIRLCQVDLLGHLLFLRVTFGLIMALKFRCIVKVLGLASSNLMAQSRSIGGVSAAEYDKLRARKMLGWALVTLILACGVHYRFGNPMPLVVQCILALELLDEPLFKIYILGRRAEGDLLRPFKPAPSIREWLQGGTATGARVNSASGGGYGGGAAVGGARTAGGSVRSARTKPLPDLLEPQTKVTIPAAIELPGIDQKDVTMCSLGCGVRVKQIPIIGAVKICEWIYSSLLAPGNIAY